MPAAHDPAGQTIMLVDGHGLAYRAFHALPETLVTSAGEPTNAVYGFTSMLLDVLRQYQPDYLVVSFDVGRTFRHDVFEAYKAQRAPMPPDLRHQMEWIHTVLNALNIPVYTKDGYEADDVIGSLAREALAKGMQVFIVTGDSDLLQLADGGVRVILPGRQRFGDYRAYDRPGVEERFSFVPERIPEYKALVGDPSDNIPGVPGIGAKTATTLIQKYPSLEDMREHLDEITPPRARSSLEANFEIALQGRELATIIRELDLDLDLDTCRVGDYDRDRVIEVFRELEFRTLVNRLPEPVRPTAPKPAVVEQSQRAIIQREDQLPSFLEDLRQAPAVALDVETTSTNPVRAQLVGIALATGPTRSYYIPLRHIDDNGEGQLDADELRVALAPVLERQTIYAHNGKYDALVMERAGFPRPRIAFDTMIAAYLLGESAVGLKELAFTRLGLEMQEITELIGRGRNQLTMDQTEIAQAAAYASTDVEATYRLVEVLGPELAAQEQTGLFGEVEMPLIDCLVDMEAVGIAVDTEFLRNLSRQLAGQIDELEREIYQLAKHPFNINSTRQLATVLFDELGLPTGRRTKTGYSVSQEVLEHLRDAHPIVNAILEYRQLLKLRSTYVDALPEQVNPETGRIHTSFNQTIAATGRLSSSDPNLQNIPVRTDLGRSVRRAFVADDRPEYRPFDDEAILVSADYSQIELRLMAHLSEDDTLVRAFREGHDIHRATAADVFGLDIQDVTPDMRRVAKTVNFGIMYGMQAYGLARDTGMGRAEAQRFIERYMKRLPGVWHFLEQTKRQAVERGYVTSMFGRRRYVPDIQSSNGNRRLMAERIAINMPLQGSAADIMKIAMIQTRDELRRRGLRSRMLLQVHDELLFEAPKTEVRDLADLVVEIMENVTELRVPLTVEVAAGLNWNDLEPI